MSRRVLAVLTAAVLLVAVPISVDVVDRARSSAETGATADAGVPGTTYAPDAAPNIVFISVDDMRLDEMRYLPRVRRILGDAGVTFSEFTAPQPLCCPSRAQLLTGQYSQNNGVRSNSGRHGGYKRLDPDTALPVWLQERGYRTAMVGKYLNGYKAATATADGIEAGWDHWDPTIRAVYQYRGYTQYRNGAKLRPKEYHTDYVARRSSALVRQMAGQDSPFFLWTSFVGPHGRCPVRQEVGGCRFPPVVAERHRQKYQGLRARSRNKPSYNERDVRDKPSFIRRRGRVPAVRVDALQRARAGALAAVDEGVEHIVSALRRSGSADNTLVVFTSDNGYLLGEHRYQGKILGYDEAVRVPLLMAGLDLPRGAVTSQTAAMIDLAPTFAELAGATPAVTVDGRPIDVRRNLDDGTLDERTLLVQAGANSLARFPTGWWFRGARTARYSYARYENDGFVELYDRLLDPFELRNVARDPRYTLVRAELELRTVLLSDCSGALCLPDFGPVPDPQS